jgi:hypothetical protein
LQAFSVHRFHSTVRATNNSDFQSRPLFKWMCEEKSWSQEIVRLLFKSLKLEHI